MTEQPDFGVERDFYTFAPELLGEALPGFDVVRLVGKGSMGLVYEAIARDSGRRVALKVLPPSLTLTERTLARFLREGRVMARVQHPDIVRFVGQGHGDAGGVRLHWFAMEFVEGVTLQQRLEIGPMPVRRACQIAARVGRALQFAHERGVVHRDVKPGNVMLRQRPEADAGAADDDAVASIAITDFGLARETGSGSMTDSGAMVGTPMYMAPELVLGGSGQAGTLADVYSLGATLYTLLTGQPPFAGPTAQSVLKQVLEHEPRRPGRLRSDVPAPLEAIVAKAMAKDPQHRYGSPLELSEDLERLLRGERVLARRPGPAQRLWRYVRRNPVRSLLLLFAAVAAGGAVVLERERRQQQLQQGLARAESALARAAAPLDDTGRQRSEAQRQELLQAAVAAATDVIDRAPGFALARFVRAKAYHRLRRFDDAIADLDAAQQLHGAANAEVLHFRIDALRQRGDAASMQRLRDDLLQLLRLDGGPHTRTLAAEHLLELAEFAAGLEREDALLAADHVLDPVGDDDPRAAVLRARILAASGALDEALAAMRAAVRRHRGNVHVHLQAGRLYEQLGWSDDARREHEAVRLLGTDDHQPAPVDLGSIGDFLGEVDRLLQALDPPREDRDQ